METVSDLITKKKLSNADIDNLIKSELKFAFDKEINGLRISNKLVLIVYNTLKQLYIEDVDNVTISAPTGSGKSIISYLLAYIGSKINDRLYITDFDGADEPYLSKSYILTSSLILQKQIDSDIDKFKMNNLSILMGGNNYSCTNMEASAGLPNNEKLPFAHRGCLGMSKADFSNWPCYSTCAYYSQLSKTSDDTVSVLNYAYWLKAVPNMYFPVGGITICDEAHLLPDIISNTYSSEIKYQDIDRLQKIVLYLFPGANEGIELRKHIATLKKFFNSKNQQTDLGLKFLIEQVKSTFTLMMNMNEDMDFSVDHLKSNPHARIHLNAFKRLKTKYNDLIKFFDAVEPQDLFFDCKENDFGTGQGYMYEIKDLNERRLISDKFISRTFKTVFLSATYGNMNVFKGNFNFPETKLFKLDSDFDFSKSPLYLTDSGWLNYANFSNNIDAVIADAIKITNLHKKDNGIIHTGTHYIANYIKNTIENHPHIKHRFLFYSDAKEKEQIVLKLKNSLKLGINKSYILVGPSLYEGLDLKDDEGRFNIVIKAPYLAMSEYAKKKMKRYPDWYYNNCLQKLEQAIGRTNRHKDDWSVVYLLDNSLKKLVLSLNKTFIDRLQYKKL